MIGRRRRIVVARRKSGPLVGEPSRLDRALGLQKAVSWHRKTTEAGPVRIDVTRDRDASSTPRAEFVPSLTFDVAIRKIECTTNMIESTNARLRRAVNARGHFPNEQAALKCLYMALMGRTHRTRPRPVGHALEGPPSAPSTPPSTDARPPAGSEPPINPATRRIHTPGERPGRVAGSLVGDLVSENMGTSRCGIGVKARAVLDPRSGCSALRPVGR